jgi:hypothetical protein
MPVRIARRLPAFNQILLDCQTRSLVCDYADVYMSCVIPINTFFLLVICKAHIDILRLPDINRSPRVRFRFLRVYVNARTWFPELFPARVNPKLIFCAGFSRPINFRCFTHLFYSYAACHVPVGGSEPPSSCPMSLRYINRLPASSQSLSRNVSSRAEKTLPFAREVPLYW